MTVTVHIIQPDDWTMGQEVVGFFDPVTMSIGLRADLSPSLLESTFWHEFVHCAEFIRGGDKYNDEQFCDQFGGLLHQLRRSWSKTGG